MSKKVKPVILEKELKKLKPIEIQEKSKEINKPQKSEDLPSSSFRGNFSESFIPQDKNFRVQGLNFESADTLINSSDENSSLEETASLLAPTTIVNSNTPSYASVTKTNYSSSSFEDNLSGKYSNEDSQRTSFTPLGSEGFSRSEGVSPFSSNSLTSQSRRSTEDSTAWRREQEVFAREQERLRIEVEDRKKLPFERKNQKREIF